MLTQQIIYKSSSHFEVQAIVVLLLVLQKPKQRFLSVFTLVLEGFAGFHVDPRVNDHCSPDEREEFKNTHEANAYEEDNLASDREILQCDRWIHRYPDRWNYVHYRN